ncbi:MAG TPA: glycosyltransferase family 4 protein [Bryobacteraceae bacterium]|nr:glycosyltransferase family 4 protein [Bryobacteraceae bacterium]
MRILQLTAGAAGMYCGTCLRDNSLATELMKQGHDVTLMPLYTPTLTDEANVSNDKIFFGGISVYLEQNWSLFRNTPWLLDRLWDSKLALKAAAKRTIPVDPHFLGAMTVSMLEVENGRLKKELGKMLAWLKTEPRPDVINLPYTLLIGLAAPMKKALDAPVCCTLQGEDLFLEGLNEPYRSKSLDLIRRNIPHVDCFLAVSDYYAEFMCRYLGIPEHKMEVARLGVNTDGYRTALPAPTAGKTRIGYFARIAPEKGLHVLAEAYRIVRREEPDCTLEAAGYIAHEHRAYLEGIERQMEQWDVPFHYHGVLDRAQKIAFLEKLDILSVPTVYADPKGIFVLEGMAAGVPFVQPHHGTFREMAERTGAGLLCEPENPQDLAATLLRLIRDRELRADLARKAYDGVRKHYTVEQMAEQTLAVFTRQRNAAAVAR